MIVDLALARRLVDEQYAVVDPAAAAGDLVVVDAGWDNLIVRLGEHLVLRLPIRAQAAPLIEHEAVWLAEVVAPLEVATPVPLFVGTPSGEYPWPWQICRWIEGTVVADVPVGDRGDLVDGLAAALVALHRPAPPGAPANPFRGVPVADRDAVVSARIEGWHGTREPLRRAWRAAVAAPPWPGPPLWLHGDPHPRNLVAGEHGLAGILDFGDLTSGDPANDLATAWWCFGPADRQRFKARVDASSLYDDAIWIRAAGWAAALASAIVVDNPMIGVALHTAEQLTAPSE